MGKLWTLLAFLLSLTPAHAFAEGEAIKVVTTFSILGDLVNQIGGDLVHVRSLVEPGEDAHTYKPTPNDLKELSQADLVVENGLDMDGWVDRLVVASNFKGSIAIASAGVSPRQIASAKQEYPGHTVSGNVTDPHAWQNIANTRIYVKNIAEALIKVRQDKADAFRAKARLYDSQLGKLDTWIKTELAPIPAERRKIITSHDAFGYFGAAYGVTFLAPQGINTEIAPTATQVAKLVEQMKAEKVKRIFFETMASPKLVKQLAKDSGATVGNPVYSDTLSKPGGPATTYISMIRYNVAQFKEAMALQ